MGEAATTLIGAETLTLLGNVSVNSFIANTGTTLNLNGFTLTTGPTFTSPSSTAQLTGVGNSFSAVATAIGNGGPITYSENSGDTLPPGMTFSTSTGVLSGTPTALGVYTLHLTAANAVASAIPIPLAPPASYTIQGYNATTTATVPTNSAETAPAPAKVTFVVPTGVRILVNDTVPVRVTAETPMFKTPPLTAGKHYFYVFKAEIEQDGKILSDSQRVEVVAGREVTVDFTSITKTAVISTTRR